MSKKNVAIKFNDGAIPQGRRVEKAAENGSADLDKVIHERMRLGITSALAANESSALLS